MGKVFSGSLGQPLMSRRAKLGAVVMSAIVLLAAPAYAASDKVAEPSGLWTGVLASDTPATLTGAQVIDVSTLEQLLDRQPVLIDVGGADRKPDNLPADTIWKPIHRSIPGAAWFPGAGPSDLPPEKVETLMRQVDELTKGDKTAPVVTFCQPKCWASWNVGKRLVQAGYTSVYWLPAGVKGWQERNDTTIVAPQEGWVPKPPTT